MESHQHYHHQIKPKKSHGLRRSISSLMDRDRPSTAAAAPRSPSCSPTRSAAPSAASALAASTTILFVPAAAAPPNSASSSRYPSRNSSRNSSPQRSLEHVYTCSIPQPMSYEIPPGRPLPPPSPFQPSPSQIRYRPSHSSLNSIASTDAKKKPLPPLPLPLSSPPLPHSSRAPLIRVDSSSSIDLKLKAAHHLSVIPEATSPTTSNMPTGVEPPALSELPGCYPTPPSSEPRASIAELESPEPEFHVHASSRPDCAICAQQEEFWGFGLGVGYDVPMTPPESPKSEAVEDPKLDELRWSKLAQVPDRGRDITSWLIQSPSKSRDAREENDDDDDDYDYYDDDEPESDIEDLDAGLFRLEQELRSVSRGRNSVARE